LFSLLHSSSQLKKNRENFLDEYTILAFKKQGILQANENKDKMGL